MQRVQAQSEPSGPAAARPPCVGSASPTDRLPAGQAALLALGWGHPRTPPVSSFFSQKVKKPKAAEAASKPDVGEGKMPGPPSVSKAGLRLCPESARAPVLILSCSLCPFHRVRRAIKREEREARGSRP